MIPIRTAVLADITGLHHLIERAYRGDSARQGWTHEADLLGGQRIDVAGLTALINDPAQRILIAQTDAGIIGCVQITAKNATTAYLGLLSVDPNFQADGLGRLLIGAAEDLARLEFGAHKIEMTVIKQRGELIAYYQRRGYALTGEVRPFPYGDERFGLPITRALSFVVLEKCLEMI